MTQDDWDKVVAVHLTGSQICSKTVWPIMREQGYGRIVMTTSTSGLYGNFGQANYGAAKTAVAGLMNTLCLEGEKYNIKVNCIAPTAANSHDRRPDAPGSARHAGAKGKSPRPCSSWQVRKRPPTAFCWPVPVATPWYV